LFPKIKIYFIYSKFTGFVSKNPARNKATPRVQTRESGSDLIDQAHLEGFFCSNVGALVALVGEILGGVAARAAAKEDAELLEAILEVSGKPFDQLSVFQFTEREAIRQRRFMDHQLCSKPHFADRTSLQDSDRAGVGLDLDVSHGFAGIIRERLTDSH